MLPVELVHGPRRDGRLDQRLHAIRLRFLISTPGLLQPSGECVARGRELCHWEPVQRINIILELALRLAHVTVFVRVLLSTISPHPSSLSLFSQNAENQPERKNPTSAKLFENASSVLICRGVPPWAPFLE